MLDCRNAACLHCELHTIAVIGYTGNAQMLIQLHGFHLVNLSNPIYFVDWYPPGIRTQQCLLKMGCLQAHNNRNGTCSELVYRSLLLNVHLL